MMAETCLLAEAAIAYPVVFDELRALTPRPTDTVETVAMAAVAAASEQNASAIIVLSTSGNTARLVSKYRPNVPIITGMYLPFLVLGNVLIDPLCRISSYSQPADSASNPPPPWMLPLLVPRAKGYRGSPVADGCE